MNDTNRVLFVTAEYGKNVMGGLGRVVNGVLPFLSRKIEIDIFYYHYFLFFGLATCYRISGTDGVKIKNGLYLQVIKRLFKQHNYTAVQFFVPSSQFVKIILYLKENYPETKLIYSCHSVGSFERYIRKTPEKIIKAEDFIINNVSAIHVLNKTSFNIIKDHFPDIEKKAEFFVIPNGINKNEYTQTDIKILNRIQVGADQTTRDIICITRWAHGKGLEYLLDAVPMVLKEIKNVRFIIAGRKEKSWENKVGDYVKLIDSKIGKLHSHVIALGWLNDKERNSLLSKADIYIMPSLLEYFPYTLLEPMIAQKPIVSSKFLGVEEIIEDNKEGLLYNPKDSAGLSEKIIFLLKNRREGQTLAKNARIKAETVYSWEPISDLYLKMYS
jgi:glycosyltransferase involved in cell wall biosynthesis